MSFAFAVACVSVLAMGLSGCGEVNGGTSTHVAQLRIIDASPDAGSIDVYLNAGGAAYNLGFGSVSSYFPVAPGTYTASADAAGSHTVLTSVRSTLSQNVQYTLLIGNVAAGLQSAIITDQGQSAAAGQIALRLVNQATRTGPVDVYLVSSGGTLASTAPIVQGIAFGQIRGYLSVPAASYAIYVLTAGTVPSATAVPLYSGSQIAFPGSGARTLVLLDTQLTAAPGVQLTVISDYDSPSTIV